MADEKKNPLGPTGEAVRRNVQRLREAAGIQKKELAARTAELGRPIPALGISRIEAGTRRVDADDLVALAVALNVHPAALLLPESARPDATADVTALGTVPARQAWEWAHGMRPPPLGTESRGKPWTQWRLRSLPEGWRPMTPEGYAAWEMWQAKLEYEDLVKEQDAREGGDGG